MRMAIALARAGLPDSARRVAERSRADATVDPGRDLAQLEAIARNVLGDKDEAFKQLSVWLATNPQQVEGLEQRRLVGVQGDPGGSTVRGDVRAEEMKLVHQWMAAAQAILHGGVVTFWPVAKFDGAGVLLTVAPHILAWSILSMSYSLHGGPRWVAEATRALHAGRSRLRRRVQREAPTMCPTAPNSRPNRRPPAATFTTSVAGEERIRREQHRVRAGAAT